MHTSMRKGRREPARVFVDVHARRCQNQFQHADAAALGGQVKRCVQSDECRDTTEWPRRASLKEQGQERKQAKRRASRTGVQAVLVEAALVARVFQRVRGGVSTCVQQRLHEDRVAALQNTRHTRGMEHFATPHNEAPAEKREQREQHGVQSEKRTSTAA